MMSANATLVYEYLQAVEAMGPYESVASFFTPDVTVREFPNRIAPRGRVSHAAEMHTGYERGRQIIKTQRYKVQRIVESGDELAVELECTGVLAVGVMNFPAGSEMKAYVAMFLTFRDGKIAMQRNYDCYAPLGEEK